MKLRRDVGWMKRIWKSIEFQLFHSNSNPGSSNRTKKTVIKLRIRKMFQTWLESTTESLFTVHETVFISTRKSFATFFRIDHVDKICGKIFSENLFHNPLTFSQFFKTINIGFSMDFSIFNFMFHESFSSKIQQKANLKIFFFV